MLLLLVCVCVCVCERERERERENGGGGIMSMGYAERQSLFITFKIKPRERGTNIPFSPSAVGCPNNWACLVAQTALNLPAIQETWVRSLGWEDPLEEGMGTHSSILIWRIPMGREAWQATVHGVAKSRIRLSD